MNIEVILGTCRQKLAEYKNLNPHSSSQQPDPILEAWTKWIKWNYLSGGFQNWLSCSWSNNEFGSYICNFFISQIEKSENQELVAMLCSMYSLKTLFYSFLYRILLQYMLKNHKTREGAYGIIFQYNHSDSIKYTAKMQRYHLDETVLLNTDHSSQSDKNMSYLLACRIVIVNILR